MKLYDTALQQFIEPKWNKTVNIYVCGITPYDSAHLGHIFTFATYDILQRMLEDDGHTVKLVRNVTDVDEPIYLKAQELGISYTELAAQETVEFQNILQQLNFRVPYAEPLASSYIFQMAEAVSDLVKLDAAYILKNGDIYFDTKKDSLFGDRVGHYSSVLQERLMQLRGGDTERADKRHPLDFLLWKNIIEQKDPAAWDTSLGHGRPGWHIECTVMSQLLLNEQIDVHGGGMDLIFPHHEAEAAQNSALSHNSDSHVKHWVHVAPLHFKGEKMSKSLGNLVFAKDLLQTYRPSTVRLSLLYYHYQIGGEWQPGQLDRAERLMHQLHEPLADSIPMKDNSANYEMRIMQALNNSLDTPEAVRILEDWTQTGGRWNDGGIQKVTALMGLR